MSYIYIYFKETFTYIDIQRKVIHMNHQHFSSIFFLRVQNAHDFWYLQECRFGTGCPVLDPGVGSKLQQNESDGRMSKWPSAAEVSLFLPT